MPYAKKTTLVSAACLSYFVALSLPWDSGHTGIDIVHLVFVNCVLDFKKGDFFGVMFGAIYLSAMLAVTIILLFSVSGLRWKYFIVNKKWVIAIFLAVGWTSTGHLFSSLSSSAGWFFWLSVLFAALSIRYGVEKEDRGKMQFSLFRLITLVLVVSLVLLINLQKRGLAYGLSNGFVNAMSIFSAAVLTNNLSLKRKEVASVVVNQHNTEGEVPVKTPNPPNPLPPPSK